MALILPWGFFPPVNPLERHANPASSSSSQPLTFPTFPLIRPLHSRNRSLFICYNAKKRKDPYLQPVLKQSTVSMEEEEEEEEEQEVDDNASEFGVEDFVQDSDDDILMEDEEHLEDDFEEDDPDVRVGDGREGGGISLAGTWWDKEAFSIAEEVSMSFDGDLKIYAFRTYANSTIRVRIEKLSSKSGSPSMTDIEAFSTAYRARLDEAEESGKLPVNISLEVSSPGVERVIQVPEDLKRFKDRPMFVKYITDGVETANPQENEGIFRLVSYDMDLCNCIWAIADVKKNRTLAGKGRPLSKKQKEWRLQTPFEALCIVRLYSDC